LFEEIAFFAFPFFFLRTHFLALKKSLLFFLSFLFLFWFFVYVFMFLSFFVIGEGLDRFIVVVIVVIIIVAGGGLG
jgi:hypothetical protein